MPNFFDAFKMATCEICGREVVLNGIEAHVNEHGIYEVEDEGYDE